MNWTGGALPRSRNGNAKSTLNNLQKKHFAKVRGKLLNAPASSPEFDPSIFKDAQNRLGRQHQDTSRKAASQERKTQTRLEAYDDFAPVVRKLESIKPYRSYASPHRGFTYGPTSLGLRAHGPHPSKPHVESADGSFRHHFGQHKTCEVQLPHPDPSTESFEVKRQDLLRRTDWVGLANTKPVEIRFSTAQERDLIGKRRHPDSAEQKRPQSQFSKRQRPAYNFFEERRPPRRYGKPSSSLTDISIRIGDSEERNNTQSRQPAHVAKLYTYGSTPDEMLLDSELSLQGSAHGQDGELTATLHPTFTETSSISARQSQANGRTTPASLQTSWAGFSPWAEVEDMMICVKQEPDPDERTMNIRDAIPVGFAPHLNDHPWAGIPGLPLVFSGSSQEPIEVSSGSDSASVIESEHYVLTNSTPVQDRTNGMTAPQNYHIATSKTDHDVRGYGELNHLKSSRRNECTSPRSKGPFHGSADVQETWAGDADWRAKTPGREELTLDMPVEMRTYTATEPKMSSKSWWVADKESTTPEKKLATPKNFSAIRAAAPSPPIPLRSPTPADEELIWRKFVFGSSDVDRDWTLEDPIGHHPTTDHTSTDHSSSPTTTSRLNCSSLLAEASCSSRPPRSTTTNRSSSPDHRSLAAQPSATPSLHPLGSTSPSYTTTPSLPSHPLRSLSPSKYSLEAQASASTSPPRTQHTWPSLSSDELATTPARPTFVFRKPARYVAREGDVLGRIHLGRGMKRRGARGRRQAREVEVWDEGEGEDGGEGGMMEGVEDEIEDDVA